MVERMSGFNNQFIKKRLASIKILCYPGTGSITSEYGIPYCDCRSVPNESLNFCLFFRIVLMPGTEREKAFSFATTQVSEWSTVGNVPVTGNYTADGKIDVKFVMRYCQLKEKKF